MLNRTIAPPVQDAVNFNFQLPVCKKATLSNGIPVYWLSAGTQDVIQIEWIFRAGLWEEDQTGVAYATAGLLKTGTTGKSSEAVNEALEFYGASLKSTANNDYTSLTLHCLTKHLSKVLPIVREILLEAAFRESELEIYRKNALQHLSVNSKKVDFVANREADAQVFGYEHPYGRFNKEEDLKQLRVSHLKAFHRQYYIAANCRIFMAGHIDDRHLTEVGHYFGQDAWGALQERPETKSFDEHPAKERKLHLSIREKSVQGAIRIISPFPTRQHPDFVPMTILNTILGGYFGSRLMANIREQKGYTYGIYSVIYAYRHASCFTIATEAGKEVCDAVIAETWKELNRLCEGPVPREELSLVKNYLFGNLLGSLDGPFNLIGRWKQLILNGFGEEHFYENIERYRNIDTGRLQALAQQYFRPERFYEVLVV